MTSQIPFKPVTPEALATLTPAEQHAFAAAATYVAGDQKPPVGVIVTLVETVQRLITEPALPVAARRHPAGNESACWLCRGLGGVAVHLQWTAERGNGKPLWTAHEYPSDDPHPVEPCPVCAGRVPALPVGAVFDHAALRERIASALDPDSPVGTVIDALMAGVVGPLLEQAGRAGAALERMTAERDALTGEVAVLESRLATREGRHAR
jgi:hypothetical protein